MTGGIIMAKYEGIGEFGKLLADTVNSDPRSLKAISQHLGIEPKNILGHIRHEHKPNFYTAQIYAIYLNRPLSELRKMIDEDYRKERVRIGEFSEALFDLMIKHDLTSKILAEKIGVSHNTVRNWFRGRKISNRSCIKCMRFFLDLEGIDYDFNTKLKEII